MIIRTAPKLLGLCLLALTAPAFTQQTQPSTTEPSDPPPAQQADPQPIPPPRGTVLFNRSDDAPDSSRKLESIPSGGREDQKATVSDDVRSALTFTAYDLDAHLTPAQSQLVMRARFTVRNDSPDPLPRIAFQLSSTLRWERFATTTAPVLAIPFVHHRVDTDTDHTGEAEEAILTLPTPLQPGATLELTAVYSGTITASSERLERIGAPLPEADFSDWDRISPETTALRGYGNVLWYPVSAPPLFLGDGAKLFQSVGRTRLRNSAATIHLRLAVEYIGDPPDAAFFCGRREPLANLSENINTAVSQAPGIATADFATQTLGFRVPSLFLTDRAVTPIADNLISAVTDNTSALDQYAEVTRQVQPLLTDWLGQSPLTALNLLDHQGQPFEDDALLVAPIRIQDPSALSASLVHSLTHAWFRSSHVWLDEGVPQFLSLLWTERSHGRDAALQQLQQQAQLLALAEPAFPAGPRSAASTAAPGESSSLPPAPASTLGQSLIEARDEVYYRNKAAAVLWMLRSLAGDAALKSALQVYRRETRQDPDPREFELILEKASHKDLAWFFDDWVYNDRGLPDLSIVTVAPRQLPVKGGVSSGWLVAVEVHNDGDAAADVPVTVRSGALTATDRLRIDGHSTASVRIIFQSNPDEVLVNDGTVPEVGPSIHTRQIVMRQEQ